MVTSLSFATHTYSQTQTFSSTSILVQQSKEDYDLGQFNASRIALEKALQISKDNGERLQEVRILSLLSLTYEQLDELELAKQAIANSLFLLETIPVTEDKNLVRAQLLNRQGIWQLNRGQPETALKTLETAEKFYASVNDERGIFISKINQAQAWQGLGYFRRATQIANELTKSLKSRPASAIKLNSLNSLGELYRQQGNLTLAESILQQSLAVGKKLNLAPETSKVLYNLGNLKLDLANQAEDLGDRELVVTNHQQALKNYRQATALATFPLYKLQARLNQLGILIDSKNFSAAENLIKIATRELEQLPPSRQTIYAGVNLARNLMKLPDDSRANIIDLLDRAISQAQSLQDRRGESLAIGTVGKYYETRGELNLAEQYSTFALAIAQKIKATDLSYQWEWQLGRLLREEQKPQEAILAYSEAVDNLQLLRRDLIAIDTKARFSFRERVEPVYRQLVELLLESDSQQNLRQARQVIESLQEAQLENFFHSACLIGKPQQLDRIAESEPTTAVFYPIILPQKIAVIAKLPGTKELQHYQSDRPEAQVKAVITQLQQYLKQPDRTSDVKKLSQQLYRWLIAPVASELERQGVKTLVFVPDDLLRSIPMGVLYDPQQQRYLLEKYAIAVAPGLQLLAPEPIADKRLRALVAGLSTERAVGGKEFLALNNVNWELEQIQSEIDRGKQLLNNSFTKENLRDRLDTDEYTIVHLATHGQFSSQLQDTFVLTWDSLLDIGDLEELLLLNNPQFNNIELLVLSACETALGDERAALGLAGIAVRAGAKSTLATLWAVDDLSTARLMAEFYRQLASDRLSKAEALRRAQLKLWKEESQDWQRPYFWASYSLVGNWL